MFKLKEGQKLIAEDGSVYEVEEGDILQEKISDNLEKDVLKRDINFRYQMLARFVADAEYYLYTSKHPKYLWSLDPIDHADNMIALYNSFSRSEKPEWLTEKQLKQYVKELYASA